MGGEGGGGEDASMYATPFKENVIKKLKKGNLSLFSPHAFGTNAPTK
jgi:putative NIF3 family GTP cyclohydrolase 1 type 2